MQQATSDFVKISESPPSLEFKFTGLQETVLFNAPL